MALDRIKTVGIQDDAITSAKIGVDVIAAEDLAANSVTATEITNGAVTSAKLDTNIAIAGNLLVGSSSAVGNANANDLELTNSGGSGVVGMTFNVNSGSANTGNIYWRSNAANNNIQIVGDPISNYLAFATSGAEKMRLDSSGNLLVGKTSVDYTTVGFEATPSSAFQANAMTADGKKALLLARKTSDGEIVQFRKDTTVVGSIGTNENTDLYIAGGDTGLLFNDNVDFICPATATGAGRDNAIDLGFSTVRFKDFYLSGGVYLGGTGSANQLDDYEEGTFTPTMSTASSHTTQQGFYTKVGRIVHCQVTLEWIQSGTTAGALAGLPFTIVGQNYATIVSREWYSTGNTWNAHLQVGGTQTTGFTYGSNSNAVSNGQRLGLGLTFVYRVS